MFAERLKEIRNGAGMTQVQLAEALGVSKGTVAMWEIGKREPNYETLNALSGIFDKRIDYILGYSNDSSSARLSEEQIEQLGAWMVEDDAQEEFMDIMALDNYNSNGRPRAGNGGKGKVPGTGDAHPDGQRGSDGKVKGKKMMHKGREAGMVFLPIFLKNPLTLRAFRAMYSSGNLRKGAHTSCQA